MVGIQAWVFGRPFLENEQCVYHKENDCKHLLPLIKFKLSSKNYSFRKLVSATNSLIGSQYQESFLRSVVILITYLFDVVQ